MSYDPPITTNLVHRYCPALAALQSSGGSASGDGDPIGSLPDQIGSDDIEQASASLKPTYLLDANGQPFARFDGSADYIQGSFSSAITQGLSIVVVGRIQATGSNVFVHDGGPGGTGGRCILWHNLTTLGQWAGSGPVNNGTITVTDLFSSAAVYNGASSFHNFDSTEISGGNPGSNGLGGLTLGARYTGGNTCQCDIYDVLVYSDVLSSVDADTMSDWGLSLYSSAPPSGGGFVDNTTPILRNVMGCF